MKRLVVFSGAGMSAESGIATFRGSDGLWESHRIEDVATPEAWQRDPDLVTRFYNMRRKKVMEASPNDGHRIIASLEKYFDLSVITQNIDDLHERAGSSHVMHLHGEIMQLRSSVNPDDIVTIDYWEVNNQHRCPKGSRYRPNIVWFGEAVPMFEAAAREISQADMLVVVGTSLLVYPAAGLVHYAPPQCQIFVVDPNLDALPGGLKATMIKQGAQQGLRQLADMLL